MNNAYMNKLIQQYKRAYGIYKFNIKNESDRREFEDWLKDLKTKNEIYLSILKDNNIRIGNDLRTAEVFKGGLDMVTGKYKTKIISNYIDEKDNDAFIKGTFKVYDGIPKVISQKDGIITIKDLDDINTFMTQNPYSPGDICGWDALHNNAFNIIFGVYGNKYDRDKKEKMEMASQLEESLNAHVIDGYYDEFGSYYYFVASDQTKIK